MLVRVLPLAVSVLLIGVATLTPARPSMGWESGRFDVCLFCGEQGGLDAINNVLLFLPFGAAAAARGWRAGRTMVTAASIAGAVELIQFLALPGRYPGLGDVLFNTFGAAVGAALFRTWRGWMMPSPRAARVGAVLGLAALTGVAAATSWLLTFPVPDEPLTGQWAPRRAVPFTGRIHAATINGDVLPADPLDAGAAARYRAIAQAGRAALAADVTSADEPPGGLAPIVRLVSDAEVHLALGQSGNSFVFMPALRSRQLGLRSIAVRVPASIAPSSRVRLEGSVEPRRLRVSVESAGRTAARRVDLTVGLGWALLAPRRVTFAGTPVLGSLLWLAALTFPVGFYAGAARAAGGRFEWWLVAPAALALALVAVPAAAGITWSGWTEWVGGLAGAAAGAWLSRAARRARIVHGRRASAWTADLCPGTSGSIRAR